jgi:hypothetical protein
MKAPRLTSDGVAAVLRFRVEYADYLVDMTPDPRRVPRADRPVPAEPIRHALDEEGYSILGRPRTKDGRTHQGLSDQTGIPRRTISLICSGDINDLTDIEAEAILIAIDRQDLYNELAATFVGAAARQKLAIDEALEEIYELFWICNAFASDDERVALEDLHLLYGYGQLDAETIRLPFTQRQKASLERFRASHDGHSPHPVSDSLRRRALAVLARRRDQALEEAATARREIGVPEHVNAARARDLMRNARQRGLIGRTQRPIAFGAGRPATNADRSSSPLGPVEALCPQPSEKHPREEGSPGRTRTGARARRTAGAPHRARPRTQ